MTMLWMAALIGFLPALLVTLVMIGRGPLGARFVALQFAITLCGFILVAGSFAFDQSSEIDLPLTLALVGLPGGLAMALFLERWL